MSEDNRHPVPPKLAASDVAINQKKGKCRISRKDEMLESEEGRDLEQGRRRAKPSTGAGHVSPHFGQDPRWKM